MIKRQPEIINTAKVAPDILTRFPDTLTSDTAQPGGDTDLEIASDAIILHFLTGGAIQTGEKPRFGNWERRNYPTFSE